MAFIYNVYERDNKIPNAKTPRVAVAYNRQIRQISTKELAEDISDRCTVHRADVQAVLDALSISATNYLLNGFGVRLGELGSLSMKITCKAAPTLADFTSDNITGAKVHYTPSVEILAKVKENGFVKASTLTDMKSSNGSAPMPGGGESNEVPVTPPNKGGSVGE